MRWAKVAILAALVVGGGLTGANAQTEPNVPLKEVDVAAGAFSRGDPVPSWVEAVAVPSTDRKEPIVGRLSDVQFMVADTPVTYFHAAIAINDPSLLTSAGQLPIEFVPEYQKLQLHAVRVLRGSGETLDRTASSGVRFLRRETGLEQGVYSDVVTASILVNDLRAGDTLEYSYSLQGQNPVFGGKFVNSTTWDQPYPVIDRRVVLNYPASRKISWRMVGDVQAAAVVPAETTDGDMRKLRFEQSPIAEVIAEPGSPADYQPYRWLQFSEFANWNEVAAWANALFTADAAVVPEVQEVIEKIRARATDEERAVAALEFAQSEIRYFSVSLGESSHRPTASGVVLKRRSIAWARCTRERRASPLPRIRNSSSPSPTLRP